VKQEEITEAGCKNVCQENQTRIVYSHLVCLDEFLLRNIWHNDLLLNYH